MGLSRKDTEFRLPKISYLDFKHLEMDRVFTALFARLHHSGRSSRLQYRKFELTIDRFTEEFIKDTERFEAFHEHPDIVRRWIETHLLDVVNRGKVNQAVAAPRPLHIYTYRFRNPRHSRDYNASQHIYETLYQARNNSGSTAVSQLKNFFSVGIDPSTKKYDKNIDTDVETQALLSLNNQAGVHDAPDSSALEWFKPLCIGSADLMADDISRLLVYKKFIPRSVMVEYLKILLAFHMALYHLRLMKLVPVLVQHHAADSACSMKNCPADPKSFSQPQGDCPHLISLVLDIANQPNTPMANLAEKSAETHFNRIPSFVQAYYTVKKLDEFAERLIKQKRLKPNGNSISIEEVLQLLEPGYETDRTMFFGMRMEQITEDTMQDNEDLDPDIQEAIEMGLGKFETYIECVVAKRGAYHRRYIMECLDTLMLKNRPGALLAQSKGRKAARRFMLDSRLLEVLLQLAVLRPGGALGYQTASLRVEELLDFLRERYGLYIDRLPKDNEAGNASIADREALRDNFAAFKMRLREIGFYRDLSDAYITQIITPRYTI
ncbi:MAG: hypothetical protein GY862_20200 [Gammaproteobacteria bacterium]|nr:hypothetical protein [Gammaproteobacteria bacterium]